MPHYPTLYQVNIRVCLNALAKQLGRHATLDDIPEVMIADWAQKGFEWIWLLSIWQTGLAARTISRQDPSLRIELQQTLPDLVDDDIGGSGFAIRDYCASVELGGNESLARLRERMSSHGLKLMLDFVPNHMAPDHRWLDEHPDYFVLGSEEDLANQPKNYRRISTASCERIVALGRDPYFSGWADTLQLNYGNLALQHAMLEELEQVSKCCDGVRCDMAMLILPSVFKRTWGIETQAFWPNAIRKVRESQPGFVFMAEVYWDLEWELQQQGFDYCYDKRLLDRLRDGQAGPVHWHLVAGLDFQNRLARFLENHDEARAAEVFSFAKQQAAAVITYMTPGLRFFHQGQLEGHRKRISPHVIRSPIEATDPDIASLYRKVLNVLRLPILQEGAWQLLDPKPIDEADRSHANIVAFQWSQTNGSLVLVVVNYSESNSRAFIKPLGDALSQPGVQVEELMDSVVPEMDWKQMQLNGLPVDLPAWAVSILSTIPPASA